MRMMREYQDFNSKLEVGKGGNSQTESSPNAGRYKTFSSTG